MGGQPAAGLALCALVTVVAVLGPRRLRRLWALAAAVGVHLDRRRAPSPQPLGRPIELIARDAQRLGQRFRYVPPDVSFARFEGRRRAYDEVLAEACRSLGVEHLLEVLPPGQELDIERLRVEAVLDRAGLRLDDVA